MITAARIFFWATVSMWLGFGLVAFFRGEEVPQTNFLSVGLCFVWFYMITIDNNNRKKE